jgi:hypothetical protein
MPSPTNQRNNRPAEQQVRVDALDQLPLRTDRIKCLQQQRAHQPLRRDRLAANRRIKLLKLARQRLQRGIGDLPNHPQRMIRANPILKIYIAEKTTANPIVTAHRNPLSPTQGITMHKISNPFSAAC